MMRAIALVTGALLFTAPSCRGQPDAPAEEPTYRERLRDQGGQVPADPWLIDESIEAEAPSPPPTTRSSSTDRSDAVLSYMVGVFFLFYMVFIGGMVLLQLAGWVAKLLAVCDCARRDFDDPSTRAIWCLLIVLTYGIGAVVYYFVVYRPAEPPYQIKQPPAPPPPMEGAA